MGYSAIDPDAMEAMISSLSTAAETLQDTDALREDCAYWGFGEQFVQINAIGAWVEGELPMLRRRLSLARALESQAGTDAFVRIVEPPAMTAEEAARIGRELAARLAAHNRTDEEGARLFHEIALELAKYEDDPDVMSAFYGQLGSQYTQLLPRLMVACGSETAREDLEIYSRAFGTAMDDADPPAEFTQVTTVFTQDAEGREIDPGSAWGRLAMVQYGNFPPSWLSKVVRVNALDAFAEDPNRDFRGGSAFTTQYTGLPEDVVALAFSALANNPEAARTSLLTMGGPNHRMPMANLVETVYSYARAVGSGDDAADAFGLAIESGAGVHDESAGDHSPAASKFAFDFIVATSGQSDPLWRIKDSLSAIGASYTHEFAASSSPLDRKPTAFGYSDDAIAGLNPAFTLDPRVVYGYLHGFADDDLFTGPFDQAMGQVYVKSLIAAAQADHVPDADDRYSENFETINQYFGGLAGIEYEAKEQVRGDMDEADERMRGIVKDLITFPLNFVPGDQVLVKGVQMSAKGARFIWELTQYGVEKGLDAGLDVAPTDTRVGQLENLENRLVLAQKYVVAQALLDADYPVRPMPASVGTDGQLKPFDQIDPAAFEAWIESNEGPESFEDKMEQGTLIFLGGSKYGEELAAGYEAERR
jgi:hypothetical protein